jgi:hypothetical protein
MLGSYCLLQLGLTPRPTWLSSATASSINSTRSTSSIGNSHPHHSSSPPSSSSPLSASSGSTSTSVWSSNRVEHVNLSANGLSNTWFERVANLGVDLLPGLGGLRLGVCVPNTCSAADVDALLNKRKTSFCLTLSLSPSSTPSNHSHRGRPQKGYLTRLNDAHVTNRSLSLLNDLSVMRIESDQIGPSLTPMNSCTCSLKLSIQRRIAFHTIDRLSPALHTLHYSVIRLNPLSCAVRSCSQARHSSRTFNYRRSRLI